jgi:stage II sporulation protein D
MEGAIVELSGQGEGHGVGLCQYGSAELARRGWDARRILELYFVNAIVGR